MGPAKREKSKSERDRKETEFTRDVTPKKTRSRAQLEESENVENYKKKQHKQN